MDGWMEKTEYWLSMGWEKNINLLRTETCGVTWVRVKENHCTADNSLDYDDYYYYHHYIVTVLYLYCCLVCCYVYYFRAPLSFFVDPFL
jgi:hypothetical protein